MSKHRHMQHETVDHEDYFTNFMTEVLPKAISAQINCINIGKVTHYDKKRHVADIQPLPLQLDNEKMAVITNTIVPASIYSQDDLNSQLAQKNKIKYTKLMKVGAVVCIGFFDRELDNYHGNNSNYKIESDRMHSLNDAIVLGVIKP